MGRHGRELGAVVVLGIATFGAGCRDGSIAAPGDAPAALLEPAGPLHPARLIESAPSRAIYDRAGEDRELMQEEAPRHIAPGLAWWMRLYPKAAADGKPEREVRLVVDKDGNIAEPEEINRAEKVEIEYSPALVILPASLAPQGPGGNGFTQRVKMVVHPLGDRSRTKASGQAEQRVRYVGDEVLKLPGGEVRAHKIVLTFTAELSPARTVNTSEQWWAEGLGLVQQRDREVTRVMGAKIRDNSSSMTLRSHEK